MLRELGQRVAIIHIDPRIGLTRRPVELREVRGDIDASSVEAQIAMMTGHGHFFEHMAVGVGFHEQVRPAPVDCVFVIRADALKVMRISALAGG
jgi:hypothetical protein